MLQLLEDFVPALDPAGGLTQEVPLTPSSRPAQILSHDCAPAHKDNTGLHRNPWHKAVIDRRLRLLCCVLGSYFRRPKSSPVRPLVRDWYYCAQAQDCVCAALQLGGDVEQPRLMTSSTKPEVYNISLHHVAQW